MKSMSSSLTFFLLLFLLSIVSSAFAASPDSYEPDNTFGQATTITAGVSAHHSIYPTTDHDFVKFTLTATEDIELTAIVGINPPYMKINLYDSHELPLADDSDNPPVIRMRLPPGTYYAEYQHSWNDSEINEYGISLKTTVGSGDAYEPDNHPADATSISAGVSAHHSIVPANDHDWVKFTLTAVEDIELTAIVGINPPYMKINLYDSHDLLLADDSDNPPVIRMRLPPGTYYAEYQHSWNEEINEYGISLKTTVGSGDAYEPDNRPEDATRIAAGVSAHHSIVPANDHDWVKFTLTATDYIELTTTNYTSYMKIDLYDDYGLWLASDSDNPPVVTASLSPGTYYAEYQHSWNEEINEYPIVLNATYVAKPPGKPARPYASDGNFSDKVKVTWNNHSGIIYKVYRCRNTSTTSCTKIGYTTSPFSDYHATHNVVYYYRIKACNNIGCSAFSNYDSGYRRIPKLPALMTIIQYILNN